MIRRDLIAWLCMFNLSRYLETFSFLGKHLSGPFLTFARLANAASIDRTISSTLSPTPNTSNAY